MRTTTLFLSFAAVAAFADAVSAQRLASYMAGGPGFAEHQPPTPVLPGPVPPLGVYPAVPALPPLAFPAGDSGFNNVTALHWVTNGMIVATQPTPSFPPAGPVLPPFPIPPAVLAPIGGVASGLAVNPAAGMVWLAGPAGFVIGVGAIPAMPILVPPFPIPLPAPLTGLEWDGATGTLWAVNAAGVAFNFFPGGAPAGPPVVPAFVLPAPAQDVAIDKTMRLNGAGARPLYVIAGPMIVDIADPLPLPFPTAMPGSQGLAFLDHPAAFPPIGSCACPGGPMPVNFVSGPMASGNVGFTLGMTGLAPGGIAVWGFDYVFDPTYPLANAVGCGLGLILTSPSLVAFATLASPAGVATFPVPLPAALPPGVGPLLNQNATPCAADPVLGVVISPMQYIQVSGL
jgi:hypothetical protein